LFDVDWAGLFIPSGSVAEIVIRGSIIYLAIFLGLRFMPRRAIGGLSASDLLIIVLIADAVQNAMAGGYESITEGLLLGAVIFGWAVAIDWIDYKFPHWHLAAPRPLPIIENGRLIHENMKRDGITEDEVESQLRLHGLDSPRDVAHAYLEGDGPFSVLVRGGVPMPGPQREVH
jgi:uncharacterized membrane protein YcaP (DUF421 family)